MHIRGIRGATIADDDSRESILEATRELLQEIVRSNGVEPDEIAAAMFVATTDLHAYPAEAARQLGWLSVPLLSFSDVDVPGSLRRCLRILLLWNTARTQDEVVHVYLRGAEVLRPDLADAARGRPTPYP